MNLTFDWFVKNTSKHDEKNKVLFTSKHLHVVKTKFNYGYRSIGLSIRKSVLDGKFYGGLNFVTGQIYFSWR